ncbi:MAG: GAF domain-containing sensor histidine kinase [Chitinophagaceae bacterium]|nr:MAG: GAF domain-containing sensor histidine kinase [Chitinophagaceae bacterium]
MTSKSTPSLFTEKERLYSLHSYQILDTAPEVAFNNIVQLAARIYRVPIAFISFIDSERIWFKASHGIDATEMPRTVGLCGHTLDRNEPLIIEDALTDELARNNSLVTGAMSLRFYASVPLVVKNGHKVGTLCIADRQARKLTAEEQESLEHMAGMVVELLELRVQTQQQNDVLSHLSHELKNSISLVIGYASLVKDMSPGEEGHDKFCDVIFNAGKKMGVLVEEALTLGASRSTVFELKKSRFDLPILVNEIISRYLLMADAKHQQLLVEVADGIEMEGDPLKVGEIIENLISNAIKYSPSNAKISLSVKEAREGVAQIIVQDQGPGLTTYDIEKLFQPFTRLTARPTAGESSTGMGLYIAHKLVELHKGRLWAENNTDAGARFIVELPCCGHE